MCHRTCKCVKKWCDALIFEFWKGVWPNWPATPISYRAKTDKWIFLLSCSNFLVLWVEKRNREFFQKTCLKGLKCVFSKMFIIIFIDGVILYLGKRLFEPFEITFLKKTLYTVRKITSYNLYLCGLPRIPCIDQDYNPQNIILVYQANMLYIQHIRWHSEVSKMVWDFKIGLPIKKLQIF